MPSGTEFTLRAKMPAATPAIKPLIVEPKMIPANCARTAGVNHADPQKISRCPRGRTLRTAERCERVRAARIIVASLRRPAQRGCEPTLFQRIIQEIKERRFF